MLNFAPADNVIIKNFRKQPASGPRPLTPEMQQALEDANKHKRGGKRKTIVGPSEPPQVPKKIVKKPAHKPRSPSPVAEDVSDSHTISDIQRTEQVQRETKDITKTSEPLVS